MRIGVVNIKGGEGKTTLCANVCLTLAANNPGGETLAIDTDPQGSLETFFEDRAARLEQYGEVHCVRKVGETPRGEPIRGYSRELLALCDKYKDTVVDCGARADATMAAVLKICHAVLVPATCGQQSLDALEQMLSLCDGVKESFNPGLKVAVVINRAPNDPHDTYAAGAAAGIRERHPDIVVMDTMLKNRKNWLKSASGGHAIWEVQDGGKVNKAAAEFSDLIKELVGREVI
jgi:cellulose biosynthesis protein BcsQ